MKFGKNGAMNVIYSMMLYGVFCISHIAYGYLVSRTREELLTVNGLQSLCIQQVTNKNIVDVRVESHRGNKFLLINAGQISDAIGLVEKVAQKINAKIISVDDSMHRLQSKSHQEELVQNINNIAQADQKVIVFLYNLHEKAVGDIEEQIAFLLDHYVYHKNVYIIASSPLVRVYVRVNYDGEIKQSVINEKYAPLENHEKFKSIVLLSLFGISIGLWVMELIKAIKNRNNSTVSKVIIYVQNPKKDAEKIDTKSKETQIML